MRSECDESMKEKKREQLMTLVTQRVGSCAT
jgi:hypothetical protein